MIFELNSFFKAQKRSGNAGRLVIGDYYADVRCFLRAFRLILFRSRLDYPKNIHCSGFKLFFYDTNINVLSAIDTSEKRTVSGL